MAIVRLIYPKGTRSEHVDAATRAIKSFKRFGVLSEGREFDRNAIKGVKHAGTLRRVIEKSDVVLLDHAMLLEELTDILLNRRIFGVCLTHASLSRITMSNLTLDQEIVIGLGKFLRYALVSIRSIEKLPGEVRIRAIEAAVRHELGHVFLRSEHCKDQKCIMQATPSSADFVDRFVKPELDFCRDCRAGIDITVSLMESRA